MVVCREIDGRGARNDEGHRARSCSALILRTLFVLRTVSHESHLLEQVTVFSTVDGWQLGPDELHVVLVQDATLRQSLGNVQASLSAHSR